MVILSTKLKNEIKKHAPNAAFKLQDMSINGEKRGCNGFVTLDGVTVYVNTENPHIAGLGLMCRYAKNDTDYKGGRNIFTKSSSDKILIKFAETVSMLLENREPFGHPLL
jgi:hypothetical protein